MNIERLTQATDALAYAASATEIGPIATHGMTQLWVDLPAEFNGDTITLAGSTTKEGTYTALNSDGSAVSFTAVTGWNEVPPTSCVLPYLKLVTNTATAAAGAIRVAMKS